MNESPESTRPASLPFLGVLRVTGRDALDFLQGQLTNDVRRLADGRTLLAALATPQGRVVALLRLRQFGDTVSALLPSELVEPVCVLLRRYVLRSKVQLQIAAELQVGWIRPRARAARSHTDRTNIDTSAPIPGTAQAGVEAFDYAPGRQVIAATADAWRSLAGAAPAKAEPDFETEWRAMDIADGLPQVDAVTSGAFVPQMLNLDLLDAISFSKGCYTGQEIVARTQHLGRIKRRLHRYGLAPGVEPAPLTGMYRDGTKVADVLMSGTRNSAIELLAVTNLDVRGLPLRTDDGRDAEPLELPYEVA